MKKKRKYVQMSLFDKDELIEIAVNKPHQYDQYIKGAIDMYIQIVSVLNDIDKDKYKRSMMYRHLPRMYMEVFAKEILKSRETFLHFIQGDKVTFDIQKNDIGEKSSIKVKIRKR